jgi:hypothetical protein
MRWLSIQDREHQHAVSGIARRGQQPQHCANGQQDAIGSQRSEIIGRSKK